MPRAGIDGEESARNPQKSADESRDSRASTWQSGGGDRGGENCVSATRVREKEGASGKKSFEVPPRIMLRAPGASAKTQGRHLRMRRRNCGQVLPPPPPVWRYLLTPGFYAWHFADDTRLATRCSARYAANKILAAYSYASSACSMCMQAHIITRANNTECKWIAKEFNTGRNNFSLAKNCTRHPAM